MENPIKMDDLGVPLFFGNTQFSWTRTTFGPIIFGCGNFSIPVTWMNWVYTLEGRPTPSWPKFAMIHRKSWFPIFHQELPPWKLPCPVIRCHFYLEISSSNHQFSGDMLLFRGGIAKWFGYCKMITFSKTNIWPWKWMVGRLLSFGRAYCRGYVKLQGCRVPFQGYICSLCDILEVWRYCQTAGSSTLMKRLDRLDICRKTSKKHGVIQRFWPWLVLEKAKPCFIMIVTCKKDMTWKVVSSGLVIYDEIPAFGH